MSKYKDYFCALNEEVKYDRERSRAETREIIHGYDYGMSELQFAVAVRNGPPIFVAR